MSYYSISMLNILITIFAVGFVIFIHELGHLLAAKWSKIGVYEFSIGMGPKVWSIKSKETIYSIRLFPFGGYVKVAGLDDDNENQASPQESFHNKPYLNRFITISAGSIFNILLGLLIFTTIFLFFGVPKVSNTISSIQPNSASAIAGLQKGDVLLYINGKKIHNIQKDFIKIIQVSAGKKCQIKIRRGQDILSKTIIPIADSKIKFYAKAGIYFETKIEKLSPLKSIGASFAETGSNIAMVFKSLGMLFSRKVSFSEMAGPIGIIQVSMFQLKQGILPFLDIIAMITISLGVINLFPFPVLDGGHILLLLIELIIRKPLNKKFEQILNTAGTAVLISLMAFVVLNDIINWQQRLDILKTLTQ